MIQASEALQEYINNPVRDSRQYVRIEVVVDDSDDSRISLNLADMVAGTIHVEKRAVSSSTFDIGHAYIDKAAFSVDRAKLEELYDESLIGKKIQLIYGVSEIEEDVDEEVVFYTGYVEQNGVERKVGIVNVTLCSYLAKLNIELNEVVSGTPLALYEYIENQTGIPMSERMRTYVSNHYNNQSTFYVVNESGIKSYLDLGMWLSQIVGGSLTCNNLGEMDIVYYDMNAVAFELHDDICKSTLIGDIAHFDACTIVKDGETIWIDGDAYRENILDLAGNPLLTNLEDEILIRSIGTGFFDELKVIPIRSFSCEYNGNPLIELGDLVSYQGKEFYVQSIDYGFRKTSKIEGYPIDNRFNSTAQTSKSSAMSGGSGSITNSVGILKWKNTAQSDVLLNEENIIAREVIAIYPNTLALFTTTLVLNIDHEITSGDYVKIKQIYDDVEQDTIIKASINNNGYTTISFNIVLPSSDVYENHVYQLVAEYVSETTAEETTIVGSIAVGDLETDIISFKGTGNIEGFDGTLSCEDRITIETGTTNMPQNSI